MNDDVQSRAEKGQTECIHSVSVFSGGILVHFQATGRMHRMSVPWMEGPGQQVCHWSHEPQRQDWWYI